MNYTGIGKIDIKGISYSSYVELNPFDGEILVKIPQTKELVYSLFRDKDIFNGNVCITDFSCSLPNGKIYSKSIKYLQLKRISPGNMSIYDSSLVRSFSLDEKGTGISVLTFFPRKFIIQMTYDNKKLLIGNSELIFYNHSIEKITSFKIKDKEIKIAGDKEFLILNSNKDILNLRSFLEDAISIIQGGRTHFKLGFFRNKLEINFKKVIKEAKPYGLIFHEETDISEFFTKYLAYNSAITAQRRRKYELFISYFLDSCNQIVLLENRIVNLYIALEIIDNSKTLNKTTLKNILSIDLNDADFVIKVRNHLIHNGHTLKVSIEESKNEMISFNPRYKVPFSTKYKRKIPASFYFYLLSRTYNFILTEIGMSILNIDYQKYY